MKNKDIIISALVIAIPFLLILFYVAGDGRWFNKNTERNKNLPYVKQTIPNPAECEHPDGIDLSQYNEAYDWSKVDAKFVYVRATFGCNVKDQRYEIHSDSAQRHNIPLGVYHFMTFKTSAKTQFNFFQSVVEGTKFQLRPMLDVEETSFNGMPKSFTDEHASEMVSDWCNLCREQYGKAPIIYTTEKIYQRLKFNSNAFKDCLWWVANYNDIRDYEGKCTIPFTLHQYSDKKCVEGFYWHVDCNRFRTGKNVKDLLL